jgi:hypothetical protein
MENGEKGMGRERVCLGSLYPTDLETTARRVARFRREIIAVVRRLGCGHEKGTRRRSGGMRGMPMWALWACRRKWGEGAVRF